MKVPGSAIKVLLIDNDQLGGREVESALSLVKSYDIELVKFYNLRDGIYFLDIHCPDVILLKLKSHKSHDTEALKIIQAIKDSESPVITIIEEQDLDIPSLTTEVAEYLLKESISVFLLEKSISYVLEKQDINTHLQRVQQENVELYSQLQKNKELFQIIVDSTSTLVWMINAEEKYTFLNQAWLNFSGLNLTTALRENWRERIHPDDLANCREVFQSAQKKRQGFQLEYRLRSFDDTYCTFSNAAECLQDAQGQFTGILCTCFDITRRKQVEKQVNKQAHINHVLAEIVPKIHGLIKVDAVLQTTAEEAKRFLSAEKIFVTKIIDRRQLFLAFESDLYDSETNYHSFKIEKLPTAELEEYWVHLSQGSIIALNDLSLIKIIDGNDLEMANIVCSRLIVPIISQQQLWGLFCVEQKSIPRYWQLTELEFIRRVVIQLGIAIKQSELYQELDRANQELKQLAVIDGLTKVANRRRFDQYLAIEWKRLAREKSFLSLILCDVDHFKLYNDAYGHQAGDLCLYKIAQAINDAVRRPGDLVARYGGEEFAVILPNTDLAGAKFIAQQIKSQIESLKIPHISSPVDLYVTISSGVVSCKPSQFCESEDLIAAADQGLYKAKELGRNQAVESELSELSELSGVEDKMR